MRNDVTGMRDKGGLNLIFNFNRIKREKILKYAEGVIIKRFINTIGTGSLGEGLSI